MTGQDEPVRVKRAVKMCGTCPFRGAAEAYKRESAEIAAVEWPCHTEDLYGETGIQCRGHYEAQRKFPALLKGEAE